ncbi:3'-5' exonuclease [Pseudomonas sp. ML96]|uniref:3'-5' exonuclease n=1 Tax=Pseudomonas sp. ML96 TaxID=1523503 RepID=UPI00068BA331|nr:3'-5' exonuclease [Pseudomonas sp. ML96]
MQTTTIYALICAFLVLALIGLATFAYRSAEKALATGYDQGHGDAERSNADLAEFHAAEVLRLQNQLAINRAEHNHQLEAVTLDADRRIAIFARTGRPLTEVDVHSLRVGAKQLTLAAQTYKNLKLVDQARFAATSASHIEKLAERAGELLQAPALIAESPAFSLPLLPRVAGDWLIHGHHFVVDLETESTAPDAAITSIGVVYLHIPQNADSPVLMHEIYIRTTPHPDARRDEATAAWWAEQSAEARAEVDGTLPRKHLGDAVDMLDAFMESMCANRSQRLLWGNGSSFDNVILTNAYRAGGRGTPWDFWNDRDLRTMLAIFPSAKKIEFEGIRHHALHDARHEAKQLLAALKALQSLDAPNATLLAPVEQVRASA